MIIEKELVGKIRNINWFSNCGNPIKNTVNYDIVYEDNWKKAAKRSQGAYWEEITLETRNALTEYLFIHYPDKYKKWNEYTKEAKEIVEQLVVPKVTEYIKIQQLPMEILHNVTWEILGAIMEHIYRKEIEPQFFTELFKIYESGNFPCGWKGSWPDGRLFVY
ncbi:hypothetical protein [Metabacillus fastidiosus]|uniref:hypothetical protein n=1 Tax=Metabacillus fastidiosus TaxID=1458 RepID=UPI003D2E6C38